MANRIVGFSGAFTGARILTLSGKTVYVNALITQSGTLQAFDCSPDPIQGTDRSVCFFNQQTEQWFERPLSTPDGSIWNQNWFDARFSLDESYFIYTADSNGSNFTIEDQIRYINLETGINAPLWNAPPGVRIQNLDWGQDNNVYFTWDFGSTSQIRRTTPENGIWRINGAQVGGIATPQQVTSVLDPLPPVPTGLVLDPIFYLHGIPTVSEEGLVAFLVRYRTQNCSFNCSTYQGLYVYNPGSPAGERYSLVEELNNVSRPIVDIDWVAESPNKDIAYLQLFDSFNGYHDLWVEQLNQTTRREITAIDVYFFDAFESYALSQIQQQATATATAQATATSVSPTNVPVTSVVPTATATLAPLQREIQCPETGFSVLRRHAFSPGGGVRESHHGIPDAWFHATDDSPALGFIELLEAATGLQLGYTKRDAPTIFMPYSPNHLATRRAFSAFRITNPNWKSTTSWNEILDEMYTQLGSDFGDVSPACRTLYEEQLREYLKYLLCQLSREAILNVLNNVVANSPAAVLQEMILWTYQSPTIQQVFNNVENRYDNFCRAILDRGW
jgi:hypothetical protein